MSISQTEKRSGTAAALVAHDELAAEQQAARERAQAVQEILKQLSVEKIQHAV